VFAGSTIVVPLEPGTIAALNAADGSTAWKVELATDRPVAADAEHAYVSSGGQIHALRLASGDVAWRAETGALTAPLLVHGGWVIAASVGNLAAFRAADGSTVWQRDIGPIEYRPAIDGDYLFVPIADKRLVSLDLPTGETKWEAPLAGTPVEPLALGGKVYVGASDKRFYTFDASDGEFEWKYHVGAALRGRAAADSRHVYFVAYDNILRALDRGSGALQWMKRLAFRPAAGPVLMAGAVLAPGPIAAFPVFSQDGGDIGKVEFPAAPARIPALSIEADGKAVMAVVTGGLEHPWKLSLLEPSSEPPPIPLIELTVVPGEIVEIVVPR